ncbi:MAG: cell division protein, partial [Burkholderiales bacterium]|nr:cell division protein [Burkholderiales bacterium]
MTDLQISLLAIGGTLVAGVLIYNKWQEHKAKKAVENAFADGHEDVLLHPDLPTTDVFVDTAQRHEPSMDADVVVDGEAGAAEAATESPVDETKSPELAPEKELPVDVLIDCVIPMEFDT